MESRRIHYRGLTPGIFLSGGGSNTMQKYQMEKIDIYLTFGLVVNLKQQWVEMCKLRIYGMRPWNVHCFTNSNLSAPKGWQTSRKGLLGKWMSVRRQKGQIIHASPIPPSTAGSASKKSSKLSSTLIACNFTLNMFQQRWYNEPHFWSIFAKRRMAWTWIEPIGTGWLLLAFRCVRTIT